MIGPMANNPTLQPSARRAQIATGAGWTLMSAGCLLLWSLGLIGCEEGAAPLTQTTQLADAAAGDIEPATDAQPAEETDQPATPAQDQPVADTRVVPAPPPPPPPRPVKSTDEKLAGLPPEMTRPENTQPDQPPLPAQAQKAVSEARELIEQGLLDRARFRLDDAWKFAPKDLTIHRLLGQVFFLQNNTGMAREHFGHVLRAAPDDLQVQVLMGRIFDKERNRGRAMRAYRAAMLCSGVSPSDPQSGFALYRLADLLEADGKFDAALDAFDVLSEWVAQHADVYARDPSTMELALQPETLLVRRGGLLLRLRYADEAAELLARAHDRAPGDTVATGLLLEACGAAGQYDRAQSVLIGYTGDQIAPGAVQTVISGLMRRFVDDDAAQAGLFWLAELIAQHPEWAPAADAAVADVLAVRQSRQFHSQAVDAITPEQAGYRHALHYLIGRLGEALEMPHAATEQFRLAVESDASFIPAHEALIYAYITQGRHDLAVRAADRLLSSNAQPWLVAYLRAKAMIAVGDLERATDLLTEARTLRADYQPIHLLLAEAYRRRGLFAEATDAMERAVKLDPATPGLLRKWLALHNQNGTLGQFATNEVPYLARHHAGSLEFQLMRVEQKLWAGDAKSAGRLMDDLLAQHPDDIEAQLLGVYVRLWMSREARAGRSAHSDRQVAPSDVYLVIAQMQYDSSYGQRTIRVDDVRIGSPFRADLEVWVGEAPARALRAELGRLAEIRAGWADDSRVRLMTAQVLSALAESDQAIDLWQSLYVGDPRNMRIIAGYVDDLTAAGRHTRAVGVLKDAIVIYPGDYVIGQNLALALMRAERFEDAVAFLTEWHDQAEAGSDEQWRLRIMLVQAYAGARMFDAGHKLLDGMISQAEDQGINTAPFEKEQFRLHVLAGSGGEGVALAKRKLDQWRAVPGLLIPQRPGDQEDRLDRQFVYRSARGDYDGAIRFARQDIEAWEDRRITAGSVVGMLLQAGRYDEAIEVLAEMAATAREAGDRDMLRWKILVVYAIAGRYEDGHALLDKWLADKLEVSRSEYGVWKVIYYLLAGQRDDALAFTHPWMLRDSTGLPARQAAVFLLVDARQYDRLLELLDEWNAEIATLRPLPDGPASDRRKALVEQIYLWRLAGLAAVGRHEEVVNSLAEKLADEPTNLVYLRKYASALSEVGRDEECLAALETAYRLRSGSRGIMNNLAYHLAERGIRLPYAERLIRTALAQSQPTMSGGELITLLDTQAWVFYKLGKIDDAVLVLDRVLNLLEQYPDAEDAVLWDHAGDAYYRTDRADEAVEMWRRALALAEAEEFPRAEPRRMLENVPAKIQAIEDGTIPPVAPLGEGVADPLLPVEAAPDPADDDPVAPTDAQDEPAIPAPQPQPDE